MVLQVKPRWHRAQDQLGGLGDQPCHVVHATRNREQLLELGVRSVIESRLPWQSRVGKKLGMIIHGCVFCSVLFLPCGAPPSCLTCKKSKFVCNVRNCVQFINEDDK